MRSPGIPIAIVSAPLAAARRKVALCKLVLLALSWNATLHAQGTEYIWDNSAGTARWNTTDTNWSGATWAPSSSHLLYFAASTTVTATRGIDGSTHGSAIIAGGITGAGSPTNSGTLRLVGNATLDFTDPGGASPSRRFYRIALRP